MITRDFQYVVYFIRRYEKKIYEYPFNGCSFLLSHTCKEFRSHEKQMESGEIPKNGTPVEVELFQQDGELEVGMVHNSPACTPTIFIYYYSSYTLTDA